MDEIDLELLQFEKLHWRHQGRPRSTTGAPPTRTATQLTAFMDTCEGVEVGILSFEEAFLARIMLPDGSTASVKA